MKMLLLLLSTTFAGDVSQELEALSAQVRAAETAEPGPARTQAVAIAEKQLEQARAAANLVASRLASLEDRLAALSPKQELSCEALIDTNYDEVSGNTTTALNRRVTLTHDDVEGLILSLFVPQNGTLIWLTTLVGEGANCVDDDDKVLMLFTDGSRIELENNNDFNCDANSTLYFGGVFGRQKQLRTLQQKTLKTLRVWHHGGYIQEDVSGENAAVLRKAFECLG